MQNSLPINGPKNTKLELKIWMIEQDQVRIRLFTKNPEIMWNILIVLEI